MRLLDLTVILGVISSSSWAAPASTEQTPSQPHPLATYDQSQQGENNLHLSLNNLNVVAQLNGGFIGDFSNIPFPFPQDYDYNYDYPDYSNEIEGSNSTTVTVKPNGTAAVSPSVAPPVISVAKQPCPHGMKRNSKGKCIRRSHFRFPFGFQFGPRGRHN